MMAEVAPEDNQNMVMETCWALDSDCSHVHEALYELRQASSLCDVCIVDESGMAVMAHSCILAAGSSVLKNMLLLKQTANMLKRHGVSVKIKGITAQVWTIILKYLYIGKVYIPIDTTIMEQIYMAAKMLGITPLQNLLSSNWNQLGYDIDVNKPVGPINVTLAPTGVTKKMHRSVQVDLGPPVPDAQTPVKKSVVFPKSVPTRTLVRSNEAGNKFTQVMLPIKQEVPHVPETVENMVEVSQSGTENKFMVEYYAGNQAKNTDEVVESSMDVSQQYMVEEVAQEVDESDHHNESISAEEIQGSARNAPVLTPLHEIRIPSASGHLKCKYCPMNFEKKLALVDHLIDTCSKLKRPKIPVTNEEMSFQDAESSMIEDDVFWLCPNEKCGAKFNAAIEQTEYNLHIISCLMDSKCKPPVRNVREENGCLIYYDGLPLKIGVKALKVPHAIEIDSSASGPEKLYQCGQCPFSGVLNVIAEHLAIVHLHRAPYKCKICRASFNNLVTFKQHYIHIHRKQRNIKKEEDSAKSSAKRQKVGSGRKDGIVTPKTTTVRWLHCPNEDCEVEFNGHTENRKYMDHLVSCLMSPGCVLPVYHLKDTNFGIFYDDGVPTGLAEGQFLAADKLLNIKGNTQYKCRLCSLSSNRERIANHLAVVHGKRKPFNCKHCSSAYGYIGSLIDHFTSQHTTKTYECMHCDKTFNKKDTLRRHVLRIHKREGKERHMCRGCGRMFGYAHHARRHERHHLAKRDYKCITCGKAFFTKQDLERHQDVHTGVKNFRCCRCTFTSARRSNLILHERKHGVVYGEYVCTTCDKYYQSESRFQAHLQSKGHQGGHISNFTTGETTTVEETMDPNGGTQSVSVSYRTIKYQIPPKVEPSDEEEIIPQASASSTTDEKTDSVLSQVYASLGDMDLKKVVGVLDSSNNVTYIQASDLPQLLAQENSVRVIVDQSNAE